MVYMELNGRIGNHLFQIATAATLARQHNTGFAMIAHNKYLLPEPDLCTIREYIKQFESSFFKHITVLDKEPENCVYFKENEFTFRPITYVDNIHLSGSFQSEKYFDLEIVKKYFQIPDDIKNNLLKNYGHILAKGPTSINIRRGNYVKIPHEFNIASLDFFNKAINHIGKDSSFLIISDDLTWCKKNFKGDNFHFAELNTIPLEDLFLQTLCKNNIISNSSFSWWGAWLNDNPEKIVIAPTPWVGKAYSHINTQDLIPERWIQMVNLMPLPLRIRAWYLMNVQPNIDRVIDFIKSIKNRSRQPNAS